MGMGNILSLRQREFILDNSSMVNFKGWVLCISLAMLSIALYTRDNGSVE